MSPGVEGANRVHMARDASSTIRITRTLLPTPSRPVHTRAACGYSRLGLARGRKRRAFLHASAPFDQFGGLTTMEQSAAQLSAFVNEVINTTGSRKVDIVGHSEGATMPDYYIEYLGGAAKVTRYVGVSGVKHGTTSLSVPTRAASSTSRMSRTSLCRTTARSTSAITSRSSPARSPVSTS